MKSVKTRANASNSNNSEIALFVYDIINYVAFFMAFLDEVYFLILIKDVGIGWKLCFLLIFPFKLYFILTCTFYVMSCFKIRKQAAAASNNDHGAKTVEEAVADDIEVAESDSNTGNDDVKSVYGFDELNHELTPSVQRQETEKKTAAKDATVPSAAVTEGSSPFGFQVRNLGLQYCAVFKFADCVIDVCDETCTTYYPEVDFEYFEIKLFFDGEDLISVTYNETDHTSFAELPSKVADALVNIRVANKFNFDD